MRLILPIVLLAASVDAQVPVTRVADDAKVIDRVAEASRRDLPRDLLKRIAEEDLELLRGKRSDGSYQYASFERLEARRLTDSFSVHPREDDEKTVVVEVKGEWLYRAMLSVPARRLVVTKNRRLWIDRVEIEAMPQASSTTRVQNVAIGAWMEPGASRTIDFDVIARQATVRVFARADRATGYGNLDMTLVQARIFDNANSPYAGAVAATKAILRALDDNDIPSLRAMASRLQAELRPSATTPAPASRTIEVIAPPIDALPIADIHSELQAIEDLLTGPENERRQGLDRLHQLIRRIRPK